MAARTHYTTAHALRVLENHFAPAVARSPKGNNIVCASARGSYVVDVSGRRYLDFQNGIGVNNTGHSHPRVVEAITRQIQDGIHLQQNCMISQPTIALCEKLAEVAPEGLTRFFFNCACGAPSGSCGGLLQKCCSTCATASAHASGCGSPLP
jgi:4-aminobutyrate aminotransferase-like enzyme